MIDLLPGRDGVALKAWLLEHPSVELITREGWAAFAQAADEGAPQAEQVADRWHLLKDLREAVERLPERRCAPPSRSAWRAPSPPARLPTSNHRRCHLRPRQHRPSHPPRPY